MSLDNVFMGKRVVQQIYLKNALIYQSKGWETLPSAPQVEWTKKFGSIGSTLGDCAMDQDNNIYFLGLNYICKISSEGGLVWKKTISSSIGMRMCIDHDNNIYIAVADNPCKVQKFDKNGNVVKTVDLSYRMDRFSDFISDNDHLYLSGTYNNHYDDYLYVLDKSLNIIQHRNTRADALITSDESSYIYFSNTLNLKYIEKSNFISGDEITININPPYNITTSSANIIKLIMDDMGNIYYITDSLGVYKYNINTKNTTKLSDARNVRKGLCLDYQNNIYCLKYSRSDSSSIAYLANLVKTSSDGTLIYDTQIFKTDSDTNLINGVLFADNNGNIYFIYENSNNELLITKIINLVKKGN